VPNSKVNARVQAVEQHQLLHRLVHAVQAAILKQVEDRVVFFDLICAFHRLVDVVEDGGCGFDRLVVACGEDQLTNALRVATLSDQRVAKLEASVVFRDYFGATTIPNHAALEDLN